MNRRKRLTFWGKDENDDSLARNVIAGRKTATASVASEYGKPYSDYGDGGYVPGDIVEVYDPKKRLRCLIKITDVYPVKFGRIPEKVWRGEDFKSGEEFREVHIRCMPNYRLHDDFEFMIVEFQLHEVIAAEAANNEPDPMPRSVTPGAK
jgi:uncharacterized protein YhfF